MTPRTGAPTDQLAEVLARVEQWCREHDVAMFHGELADRDDDDRIGFVVSYRDDDGSDWQGFLGVSRRLGAVIVIDSFTYGQAAFDESLEALTAEPESPERDAVLRELRALEPRVGNVAALSLIALVPSPPIVIRWRQWAEWFAVAMNPVLELRERLGGDETDDEDAETEGGPPAFGTPAYRRAEQAARAAWPRRRISEVARRLAESPLFQRASKRSERTFAARRELGEDDPHLPFVLERIVEEASNVYDLELAPRREAERDAKARAMFAEGKPPKEIAAVLGVSVQQVSAILNR